MLVVGGDEHDMAAPAGLARHFESGRAGHLDIEEDDVGPAFVEQAQRLDAVFGHADDLQFGPQLASCSTSCWRSVASSSATRLWVRSVRFVMPAAPA